MPVLSASVEEALQQFGTQIAEGLREALQPTPGTPARLHEAMQYSVLAGGKRLRPMLVLLSCEACGGDPQRAMPAACAIEMVHTYSLIHDDLPAMDNDDFRRGRPTNHVVFGEALAILAGDGLLTRAFELLARELSPATVAAACCADLARAAGMAGMVGGQVADLEAEGRPLSTPEELEAIHHRKTGALLSSALTMGARVAQADELTIDRLARYGRCLGLAFQITDDLLDVRGSQHVTGKAVQKDAARGKLTYPSLLGEEASVLKAQCLIAEACRCLEPMGERGRRLEALAQFVLERDH